MSSGHLMLLSRTLGVIAMLALASGAARADIYVWRDGAGVSHYVNDLENVPPEYRREAMPVAKDWARAAPPSAPVEPSPTPAGLKPEAVKPETGPSSSARDVYEAAYAAGFRAAELESAPPASSTVVGPIVQNVLIQPEVWTASDHLIPLPFFVERRHHPRRPDADRVDFRKPSTPGARHAPFLQGPAGPPPIGAAGPSPVRFEP